MPSTDRKLQVYEELAEWEHRQGSPQARDRFLILAADSALSAGHSDDAERFRARLLEYNPHHLLKPYSSLADALKSSDVFGYMADLRTTYPLEEAERLLASLKSDGKQPEPDDHAAPPFPPPLDRERSEAPPPVESFGVHKDEEPAGAATLEPYDSASPFGSLGGPGPVSPPRLAAPPARKAVPMRREPSPPADRAELAPESEDADVDDAGDQGDVGVQGDERPTAVSVLLSDALFFLVLAAGLALLAYTLARPFLPETWAPFQ